MQDPLDGELPKEILDQFEHLKKALAENKRLSSTFSSSMPDEQFQELDGLLMRAERSMSEQKSTVKKERSRTQTLAEHVTLDGRLTSQATYRRELIARNPHCGRSMTLDYALEVVGRHEQSLIDNTDTLDKLDLLLAKLRNSEDEEGTLSKTDLSSHIKRFDDIFAVVGKQIYGDKENVEKLKDAFMERRRQLFGGFAMDPFKEQGKAQDKEKGSQARQDHDARRP